jgi:hypothetical protein
MFLCSAPFHPPVRLQEPFQSGQEVGKLRLLALQHRLMVRAFKDELVGLGIPPLRVAVSRGGAGGLKGGVGGGAAMRWAGAEDDASPLVRILMWVG